VLSGREEESQGGDKVDAAEHRAFEPVGLAVEGDEACHDHGGPGMVAASGGEPVATIVLDVAGGAV
jgi:hypothetical protein